MTRVPGLPPRFAAWRILHDVRLGVPFDIALRRAIRDLDPDDRRLAHELAAGVFRNRTALDEALKPAVDRGLDSVRADTLDVLRIGAFQLLHLDRVPPHAAVQTTVGVVRRLGGRRVAGFVNAVLRRLAERAPSPEAPADRASDPTRALATTYSHPRWLVGRWLARFGTDATERLLAWNNTVPPLVLQAGRVSLDELGRMLDAADLAARPAPFGAGLVVEARRPTALPGYDEGAFFVQDAAQQLVTRYFDLPRDALVYDACAAPGGKSLALARSVRRVVAGDRHRNRARRLAENICRIGAVNVHPIVADATRPAVASAPAVLLDVPCLGTGTLARHPDARWRLTERALTSLAAQAGGFLETAADLVEPGGLLLFATCSLEPEENELQIERFLAEDSRFRREPWSEAPAGVLTPEGDLMTLPHLHGIDGAYAARLRKVAA